MSNPPKPSPQLIFCTAALLLPLLAGCQGMALDPVATSLDTHAKSVAIFTLVVDNQVNPHCGVAPISLTVKSADADETQFALAGDWDGKGGPFFLFWTGKSEFPVSLELPPGKYTIGKIFGGGTNLLIPWSFDFPLDAQFDLQPGSVVYLGHVVMTNRPRQNAEPRSGCIVPFLEQYIAGLSTGTMDIAITDNSPQDLAKFRAKYPCLQSTKILPQIMTRPGEPRTAMLY